MIDVGAMGVIVAISGLRGEQADNPISRKNKIFIFLFIDCLPYRGREAFVERIKASMIRHRKVVR